MSSNLEQTTLGSIADILMGQSPPGETCNQKGLGIPLLNGPSEFGSYHPTPIQFTTDSRKLAKKNDLLFCVRGSTTGRMNWADQDYSIGRGLAALRHIRGLEYQPYLKALLETLLPDLLGSATGSTFPNVSRDQLAKAKIFLHSPDQQLAISTILSSLDDKIEFNRQMCKTLEDIASTLFKSWFIDFDPVKAKAAGRELEGLSPEIAELFPDSLIDSSLGLIPSSWKIKKLGDISQIDNGFAFKSQDYRENGIYILRTKNFSDDGYVVRLKDDVFLNINLLDDYKKFLCKPFDYHLVMVGNSIGKTAYILPHQLPALRNQNMWCFRPKTENLPRFYLNLTIDYKVKSVMGWASGSARSFFRKSDFQIFDILWPSNEIQTVFEDVSSNLYKKISNLNHQNIVLIELRDLLLPKLINGEVKIQEAETLILATI